MKTQELLWLQDRVLAGKPQLQRYLLVRVMFTERTDADLGHCEVLLQNQCKHPG